MNPAIESVILVRHARSTANVDPRIYLSVPDHAIPLVDSEHDPDALEAARTIAELDLFHEHVCTWYSTYLRCKQTEQLVMRNAFRTRHTVMDRRESFLLREQEFGDWDGLSEEQIEMKDPERFERRKRMSDMLGRFYFRYPNGESRADVTQRISIFLGKVHRSRYRHHIVFLHGVTQRAFRMNWFNRGPEWFESEPNPRNTSVLRIHRDDHGRWTEEYLCLAPTPK